MIRVAEELGDAVDGRQKLFAIAEAVLAEPSVRMAARLQDLGRDRILSDSTVVFGASFEQRARTHLHNVRITPRMH